MSQGIVLKTFASPELAAAQGKEKKKFTKEVIEYNKNVFILFCLHVFSEA